MRLWHYKLIEVLDVKRLLGQHRECCALRGNGWRKNHSTVDYVFKYHPHCLFSYHKDVMNQMETRGFNVTQAWWDKNYRGKNCRPWREDELACEDPVEIPYPEHNKQYLKKCVSLLKKKNYEFYKDLEKKIDAN